MAWLTGWNRRKQLYINGTTAGVQSAYQMKITINYGSGTDSAGNIYCGNNVNSNFSDLRFTSSDGSTLLNYWIDQTNTVNGSYATVWVNISSIPTGSNSAYIYFYYNNTSGTSVSNGPNTFVFYDDFDDNDISDWIQEYKTWTVSGGIITTSGNGSGYLRKSFTTLSANDSFIVEWRQSVQTSGGQIRGTRMGFQINYTAGYRTGYFGNDISSKRSVIYEVNTVTEGNYYDSGPETNSWLSIMYSLDNANRDAKIFWNGNLHKEYVFTNASSKPTGTSTYFRILHEGYNALQGWMDYIRVRKYASPEPTWSSNIISQAILNITSTPTGAEVWLRTPAGSGSYIDQGVATNTTIGVAPGNYDIELILSGGQTWYILNQTFNADYIYNIQATFTGQLFISSTPTGAEVWIAGNDRHVTTNTIISDLNPSPPDYNITLKIANYQDWTGSATVYSTLTTNVIATFAGSANITSIPSGASVYLDGNPTAIGITPLIITNLTPTTSDGTQPTQSHTYILKLTGYTDTSGSFTATAGQTTAVPVTFPGSLYITSIPTGAQIYIDGVLQ